MKVAILAGGFGTRLTEETLIKPKPMVEIGGKPILWHIMKYYASYGMSEFVIALGYKGDLIKDYFVNYRRRTHSLTVDLANGDVSVHDGPSENWKVHLLDTGLHTLTGGRAKQLAQFVGDETFMLTYGDGVANVNIDDLLAFHRSHGKLVTITAVRPNARFGEIVFEGDQVTNFAEKPQTSTGWVNGGFFVLEPGFSEYIQGGDESIWERDPMERLAADRQLVAYRHNDFWQCMDTLRDVHLLEELWQEGNPPWKIWKK